MGLKYKLTNNTVYSLRKTAGGTDQEINYSYDTLIGGSVGWNQLIKADVAEQTASGVTYKPNRDGSYTVSGTAENSSAFRILSDSGTANHIYFIGIKGATVTKVWQVGFFSDGTTSQKIIKHNSSNAFGLIVENGQTVNETVTPTVIDLTLLLGSTIADHIYSLETATSGAGIAKLREWGFISDAYIPYDAGSIESVEASAKVTRDASDNIIGNYPLDSSLTLRGIPKLTDGKLYYDGDRYEADGTVTRKRATVVLNGTQEIALANWQAYDGTSAWLYSPSVTPGLLNVTSEYNLLLSNKLIAVPYAGTNGIYYGAIGVSITGNSLYGLAIRVSSENYRTKKAINAYLASNPITVEYELATPTTESAVPFTNPQIVDDFGTEEYVTGNGVPVGHETVYYDVPENSLSIGKVLDYTGLKYFWSKVKAYFTGGTGITVSNGTINHSNSITAKTTQAVYPITFDAQGHINSAGTAVTIPSDVATTTTDGLMSSSDKVKLNGIATGAEVNQNAFSSVKVGTTTISADSKTDTLELVAGTNITLTPDETNDKVTITCTASGGSGEMNVIETVKENGVALTVTNKAVDVIAPTNLVNGSTTGSLRTINSDESLSYTIGQYATALGGDVKAAGNFSAALNFGTTAAGNSQTVIGKYNTVDTNDTYALIIGNGSDDSSRSDALAVSWTGNVYAKDYISGTTSDTVAHSYTAVNNNRNASFRIDANGTMGMYDHTNQTYVLSCNTSKATVLSSPSGGVTYVRGGGGTSGTVRVNTSNHTDLYPIGSNTAANHRVSYFSMTNATTLLINAQANASSYGSYNIAVSSSDVRLKKNVEDTVVEALPIIEKIRMRQFDWKADDKHQAIGMIADEIEKIDPKLAIGGGYEEDGTMNVKTIDTFYLIGYLVKAVQELSERVKELENK